MSFTFGEVRYTRLREGVEWLLGSTGEGARKEKEKEKEDEQEKFGCWQDRTGQDMHGMLFGLDSKEGAYRGLKRSEVEFYRSLACLLACLLACAHCLCTMLYR